MSATSFDWNDIPLLLALARSGSMSGASRSLGLDTSTISRRLAAAETALQTRLFIRGKDGYQPTEAGLVFIQHAEQAFGEVQSLLQATQAEADGIHGQVRLTSINAIFDYWLIDRLPGLLQAHPGLQLTLIADNQNLSFTRREADFAIRMAQPTEDAALLMRKVGRIGFAVFGAGALAAIPRAQWAQQPWLVYSDELAGVPEMQWLSSFCTPAQQVLRASNVSSLLRACQVGMGLALLPCLLGARSGLTQLSTAPELHRDIWLLSHRDAKNIKRFRVVGDWLSALFESDAAVLAGSEPGTQG